MNYRPKLSRSFSDNLVLEALDPKELLYENPQPSREGLNDGWETTSEVGFYEAESSSSRWFIRVHLTCCKPSLLHLSDSFSYLIKTTGSTLLFAMKIIWEEQDQDRCFQTLALRLIISGSMIYLVFRTHTMLHSLRQRKCLNVAGKKYYSSFIRIVYQIRF